MSLHTTPEEHDADPPSAWVVVKAADRCWHLNSSDGHTISSFTTRKVAEIARVHGFAAGRRACAHRREVASMTDPTDIDRWNDDGGYVPPEAPR